MLDVVWVVQWHRRSLLFESSLNFCVLMGVADAAGVDNAEVSELVFQQLISEQSTLTKRDV